MCCFLLRLDNLENSVSLKVAQQPKDLFSCECTCVHSHTDRHIKATTQNWAHTVTGHVFTYACRHDFRVLSKLHVGLLFFPPTACSDDKVIAETLFIPTSSSVSHCCISPAYMCVNLEFFLHPPITPNNINAHDSLKTFGDHAQLGRWQRDALVNKSV